MDGLNPHCVVCNCVRDGNFKGLRAKQRPLCGNRLSHYWLYTKALNKAADNSLLCHLPQHIQERRILIWLVRYEQAFTRDPKTEHRLKLQRMVSEQRR